MTFKRAAFQTCRLSNVLTSKCNVLSRCDEVAEGDHARAQGNDAFVMGDMKKAIAAYSRGIAASPGDARGYSNRAAVLIATGNPSGALADAKRAAQIEPEWGKARARVGEALTALGRHEEAARVGALVPSIHKTCIIRST